MRDTFLPFSPPFVGEEEIAEVVDSLRSGWITTGPKTKRFEQEFGPEYGEFLEMMGALRTEMMRRFPDFETRRERWYQLVDSDLVERLREEDRDGAARQVEAILAPAA